MKKKVIRFVEQDIERIVKKIIKEDMETQPYEKVYREVVKMYKDGRFTKNADDDVIESVVEELIDKLKFPKDVIWDVMADFHDFGYDVDYLS